MQGTPAIYLGRIVEKANFRTFIYGPNDERKLVESWEEYEACMESGLWFATLEDAQDAKAPECEPEEIVIENKLKAKSKSKPKTKSKAKVEVAEEIEEATDDLDADGMVYEVTDGA